MTKQLVNLDFQNAARVVNHPRSVVAGDIVVKQDLDDAIASLSGVSVKAPQDLDCSTNPNYPSSETGQSYFVTAPGKIGGAAGINVNIGDTIICKAANGSNGGTQSDVGSEFFILESNRSQATETELGVLALASQTEVNNGTATNKAVVPLTLQTKLNNAFNSRKYVSAIGNGVDTTFTITHSLGDPNVLVQVKETSAPNEVVNTNISFTDANNIQVSFLNPPTTNQFTVSIR